MKGKPDNFDEYGYIRRIEERYASYIDTTVIRECIYEPDLHGEIDCLFTDWVIDSYNGKPDREKTMKLIKFTKEKLWKESLEGVEIEFWVSPQERIANIISDEEITEEDEKELEEFLRKENEKREKPITLSEWEEEKWAAYKKEREEEEEREKRSQRVPFSDFDLSEFEISEEEMEAFDKLYMETFPDCYDFR